MNPVVFPELPTPARHPASYKWSAGCRASVDNSAPSPTRPVSTYKSGRTVQTNRATSFPVPADCAQWCNAQRVMGVVQRAFVRRAWMDVPNEGQGSTLLLVVSEAAISDWIDKVVVFSGMERMYLAGHEQKEGGAYLFWQMQGASLDSRLTIECATLGESELWGRFSIAVTMPTWV